MSDGTPGDFENWERPDDPKGQVDGLVTLAEAFEAAAKAAEYLGDILNNMDAVDEKDIKHTAPLFKKMHTFQEQEAR